MTWIISETDVEVIRNARRALRQIADRASSTAYHPADPDVAREGMAVLMMARGAEEGLFEFLSRAGVHGHQDNALRDIHRTSPYPETEPDPEWLT